MAVDGSDRRRARGGEERRDHSRLRHWARRPGLTRSHGAHHRQRPRRHLDQYLSADRSQHPVGETRRRRCTGDTRSIVACGHPTDEGVRPRRIRQRRHCQRARRHSHRRRTRGRHPDSVPPRSATDRDRRGDAAACGHPDICLPTALRRIDQPDVDGWPRGGDRAGHR